MLPFGSAVRLAAAVRANLSEAAASACCSTHKSHSLLPLRTASPCNFGSFGQSAYSLLPGHLRPFSSTASLAKGHKRRARLRSKAQRKRQAANLALQEKDPSTNTSSLASSNSTGRKELSKTGPKNNAQDIASSSHHSPSTEATSASSTQPQIRTQVHPKRPQSQSESSQLQSQPPRSDSKIQTESQPEPQWRSQQQAQSEPATEFVSGWGPDRLQVMVDDQKAPLQPSWSELRASYSERQTPPHISTVVKTILLDRTKSDQVRKFKPGSYLSDRQWATYDQDKKRENALTARTGGKLAPKDVPFEPVAPLRKMEVARLAHGLERVLFNPGVHCLKDSRSGVYNYPSTLSHIPDVDLFDYSALTPYITSSLDQELRAIAEREQAQFCGSTSSLTSMLSQVYFLVSGWKLPSLKDFSDEFADQPKGFSMAAKLPAQIRLKPRVSTDPGSLHQTYYAIDQDKGKHDPMVNSNYVLQNLGRAMEKMLTTTPEEFASFLRVNRPSGTPAGEAIEEAYHYAKAGTNFVMRSQLDCHDERLPGSSFDLKTRAVVTVRHDRANWVEASGYQIKAMKGLFESYEREKYDMARSAWLKYFFQAKIGCMDGIFVAYHNAAQVFGFEYFPLEDMAERLFGSVEMADQAFKLSVALSEKILQRAVELYPERELSLLMETQQPKIVKHLSREDNVDLDVDTMRVWVEPTDLRQEDGTLQVDDSEDHSILERRITQFDVRVDRFMWNRIIQGPVDLDAFKSTSQPTAGEDNVHTRPIELQLEYEIRPRSDLSETVTYANQATVANRFKVMSALILPNLETTNARERRLETELSKNPEALQKYKEDKKSGVAPGMPRAPGQIDLFRLDDEGKVEVTDARDAPTVGESEETQGDGLEEGERIGLETDEEGALTGEGQWRPAGQNIWTLRKLAQKGAQTRNSN